jgi:hypothetical protein
LGTLALNGPLGDKAGFFVEAYGFGREDISLGGTTGLYFRPIPAMRVDVTAGQAVNGLAAGTATVGAGLTLKVGK